MLPTPVRLRSTQPTDLEFLFQFQLDEEAGYIAAFMPPGHTNWEAYLAKFTRHLADPAIYMQTIVTRQAIAGSVAAFVVEGKTEVTYWLNRTYWGQGIATAALGQFLRLESRRPLIGRVAFDNFGSQKVLEKCGFAKIGTNKGFAMARQTDVEEFIYRLT